MGLWLELLGCEVAPPTVCASTGFIMVYLSVELRMNSLLSI